MKISRRTAAIAGSIATLAVAGTLIAGPAAAHDRGGRGMGFGVANGSGPIGDRMPGRHDGMMGGKGMKGGTMGGPRGGMLYGDVVVRQRNVDANGNVTYTYVKQRTQVGTISSATDSAIKIKSADGTEMTWTIVSTTKVYRNGVEVKGSAFVAGEDAHAIGTIAADGTVTTVSIVSRTPRAPKTPAPAPSTGTTGTNA